ncbi:MAG: hypothetical protein COA42_19940 [Alteromonadaceae bacterium]|nr:MAG: hypothetical protein COA42_19940 [Alteromonadaceae bacterium]
MYLYTEDALNGLGLQTIEEEAQVRADFNNDAFEASGIYINIKVAHTEVIEGVPDFIPSDTQLVPLRWATGPFVGVPRLKEVHGADFVVLVKALYGGRAYFPTSINEPVPYSVAQINFHDDLHEIGHNFGLGHCQGEFNPRLQPPVELYGTGYAHVPVSALQPGFDTVMCYGDLTKLDSDGDGVNDLFTVGLDIFSNPSLGCFDGETYAPCGISGVADAARMLNGHRFDYANWTHEPFISSPDFNDAQLISCIDSYGDVTVDQFKTLSCRTAGIGSVEGIEELYSLRTLDLAHNNLTDIAPLLDAPLLLSVDITGNENINCQQLDLLVSQLGADNVIGEDVCGIADEDGDGVADDLDQCPGTPIGSVVGANGCIVDGSGCGDINAHPDWTTKDWAGGPVTHNEAGDPMVFDGVAYTANWYTNSVPGSDASWSFLKNCSGS